MKLENRERSTVLKELSLNKLLGVIDILRDEYANYCKSNGADMVSFDRMAKAIENYGGIRSLVVAHLQTSPFPVDHILTTEEIPALLEYIEYIPYAFISEFKWKRPTEAELEIESDRSPLVCSARKLFNAPYLKTQDVFRIYCRFSHIFLMDKLLPETQAYKKETAQKVGEIYQMFAFEEIIKLIYSILLMHVNQKERVVLVHFLYKLTQRYGSLDQKAISDFIEGAKDIGELYKEIDNNAIVDFGKRIRNLMLTLFPQYYEKTISEELVRLVQIGKVAYVIPKGNFYFDKHPHKVDDKKSFPVQGALEHQPLMKNISLFDTLGNKVYRGDIISLDQFSGLKGNYYLMSEQDSYARVPEDIILEEGRPNLFKMPGGLSATGKNEMLQKKNPTKLNPHYVRTLALGKIVGGVYTPQKYSVRG